MFNPIVSVLTFLFKPFSCHYFQVISFNPDDGINFIILSKRWFWQRLNDLLQEFFFAVITQHLFAYFLSK